MNKSTAIRGCVQASVRESERGSGRACVRQGVRVSDRACVREGEAPSEPLRWPSVFFRKARTEPRPPFITLPRPPLINLPRPPLSAQPRPFLASWVLGLTLLMLFTSQSHADQWSFLRQAIDVSQPKLVKIFGAGVGRIESYGTGILVSAEGHILTTQGGILDGRQVRVLTADGVSHEASVLKRNRTRQLALLKIDAKTEDYFTLSANDVGQKGDWIVALSNAFRVADKDESLSVMMGIISLRTSMTAKLNSRDIAYEGDLVLIDAITSNPGAGGGAVVTSEGDLVGMIGKIINSSETNTRLNYAVPNATLYRFVKGLPDPVSDGSGQGKPAQEIAVVDWGIRIFRLGGKRDPAYVDRVVTGSPAAKAGIKPDDLIVSIAGEKIGNVRQFDQVIKQPPETPDQIVVVKRGRSLLRLTIRTMESNQ